MKKEINFEGFTYIVENDIITAIKAPAKESGLAHAIKNIGINIKELKK